MSRLAACLLVLLAGCLAWGAGRAASSPEFLVTSAHTFERNAVYYLDATARLRLNGNLSSALDNGVALTFVWDIHIMRPDGWWFDNTVATLTQRYRLRYQPLSLRYKVEDLNTGLSLSYFSLQQALERIGRLHDFPLIDRSLLPRKTPLVVDLRIRISAAALPLPLRIRSYLDGSWRPASPWYRCALR